MRTRVVASAALASSIAAFGAVHAQGIATDQLIDSITVTAQRRQAGPDVPSSTASRTAEDLRAQNLVNAEDALKYIPNVTVRKRYIGDRNALIGGRSFSTLQAPRGLVLVDGFLLSNFLGRFDAPRWNMVAPEEIERVDVLYGPFSAIYPGNSIGTTVAIRTRRPEDTQFSVRTTGFAERFEEYGLEDTYDGHQLSAFFGHRFDSGGWLTLGANRQESLGHPMQYYTVSANANGTFAAVAPGPAPTEVYGVRFDTDPFGNRRAVFGANGGAIDHTVQNQWKVRGGYDISAGLEAETFIAGWTNDTRNENRTFMRDAAGNEIWSGRVVADGVLFNVPATAFVPSTRDERHVQWGAALRTKRDRGWNGSVVYSNYAIREDHTLQANAPDPVAALGGSGTNAERDGTRWNTFELQGLYTPSEEWGDAAHALAVGYHRNEYRLRSPVYDTADWRRPSGVLSQQAQGDTTMQALYAQDTWALTERLSVTGGVRYEDWQATNGMQWVSGLEPQVYPDRSLQAWSPKLSVSYLLTDAWRLRASAGRGVRFPTVAELFFGTVDATQITRNDPNLQPERSDALELTAERHASRGRVRVSLFQDDVRDTIWNQVNVFVFPTRNTVQNIDRVRTRGVESAFTLAATDQLSMEGSLTYAQARILRNDKHPDYVGNDWPRVPDWRGSLQAVWRPTDAWLASLAVRYSSDMYNRLENDDFNGDTYGGVSSMTMVDARLAYTTASHVELALGVDNITNELAYQVHPYPARTLYLEARWSLGEQP